MLNRLQPSLMSIENQHPERVEVMRHSTAHVLAAAVLEMFPDAQFGIGPVIENGFYYDFRLPRTLIPEDLPLLETKMREIIAANHPFLRVEIPIKTAKEKFSSIGQVFKEEILSDLQAQGEKTVSLYESGPFVDLCRGPHLDSTGEIPSDAFALTRISGAYWKSDEKREQLQRIYGVAFENKKSFEEYKVKQEEAQKRDHRKLGKELDLFTFSELVGAGLPLWTPKGTAVRSALQNRLMTISQKYDMLAVTIPHIGKRKLYETSGHAQKFGDELIMVESHYDTFCLKPVNCPHHTQIYASRPRSYRDLPLRYMEVTMQYRDEKPGEIGGLTRVRSITVDDGHIFCRVEQIKDEAKNIARIIEEFYTSLGLFADHWVSLSVRDPKTPDAYIGDPNDWDSAEQMLQEISGEMELGAKRVEGEAAIYGPKLDYMFRDSLGREWQLATIQIDFAMPKRFGLTYTDSSGKDATPVMIHRAILGSFERFLAILIEHFSGAFPLWLAPVQVAVLPVSEKFDDYAQTVAKSLKQESIRVEIHSLNESLGKRIRTAEQQKIPYILVVGEKERETTTVTVRERSSKKQESTLLQSFISDTAEKIQNGSLE